MTTNMKLQLTRAAIGVSALLIGSAPAGAALLGGYTLDGNVGTAIPDPTPEVLGNTSLDLTMGGFAAYNADTPFSYSGNTSLDTTNVSIQDGAHGDSITAYQFEGSSPWSVTMWIKTSVLTGNTQQIVGQRKASTGNGWFLGLSSAGFATIFHQGQSVPDGRGATGSVNLADGAWHFIAGVSDPSTDANGEIRLYVDGSTPVATGSQVQQFSTDYGNSKFSVGKGRDLSTGNYNNFDGLIDDVGLWNHALSTEEIDLWFSQSLNLITIPEPSTIALLGMGGLLAFRRRRGTIKS